LLALRNCCLAWSGELRDGRHPGSPGEGVADGVAVAGGGLGAKPALGLGRAQVAFGLVGCRGYPQVGEEPQDVGLAGAQAFQNQPSRLLPGFRAGDAADLLQPDEDR
jgi:hypothetical protein